jgi:hypothetical protein
VVVQVLGGLDVAEAVGPQGALVSVAPASLFAAVLLREVRVHGQGYRKAQATG